MRVLIVDDESLARQRVRRLLRAEVDVDVVGEAESGHEAVAMIRALRPDLVCLDVQMPGLDGFGVLQELDGGHVPMVLFITAYDEHAQRAFDVHAVDYVLKPVDEDRFKVAFAKARKQRANAVAAERLGELRDRVGGGVGSDHGIRPDDSLDLRKHLPLDVCPLENALDDEIGIGQRRGVRDGA